VYWIGSPVWKNVTQPFGALRQFARRVALSCESLRPHYLAARAIGRFYYSIALRALWLWTRSHRYVEAVLLTGSGGRGDLRVGVSDLDVLMVVKDGPLRDVFIDRCVVELALLARCFPMISAGPIELSSDTRSSAGSYFPGIPFWFRSRASRDCCSGEVKKSGFVLPTVGSTRVVCFRFSGRSCGSFSTTVPIGTIVLTWSNGSPTGSTRSNRGLGVRAGGTVGADDCR